jgi:hypothetical protein
MPPKAKIPAPIDRPLSRAYLREFTGWSTAYPPGVSDSSSLRIMENVMIQRDGSVRIRPGMRFLTYSDVPSEEFPTGLAFALPVVGTHEPFFLNNGTKAYLMAVREADATVGFRVLANTDDGQVVITCEEAGFAVPQGWDYVKFTEATTYVKYLQIDNKVLALSDAGEPMRIFFVGANKFVKRVTSIDRPEWSVEDKLTVVQPEADWLNAGAPLTVRTNYILNGTFEENLLNWVESATTEKVREIGFSHTGTGSLRLTSKPERTNLVPGPLHDPAATGLLNWAAGDAAGTVSLDAAQNALKLTAAAGPVGDQSYAFSALFPVTAGKTYTGGFDVDAFTNIRRLWVMGRFYNSAGVKISEVNLANNTIATGRRSIVSLKPPTGCTQMRLFIKIERKTSSGVNSVSFSKVLLSLNDEPTTFFYGGSGTDYFWEGEVNDSASVYHPPANAIAHHDVTLTPGNWVGSAYVRGSTANDARLDMFYKSATATLTTDVGTVTPDSAGGWTRLVNPGVAPAGTTKATIQLVFLNVPRGETHWVDSVMIEEGTVVGDYFDGASVDSPGFVYEWAGDDHNSKSTEKTYAIAGSIPGPETRTADTLISSTAASNIYNFAFFYTIANEVGESAVSAVTTVRTQRPWSAWKWETPNAAGEPSGTPTSDPTLAADQLVAYMPQIVFDQAAANGATQWNLYMYTWSDQDPVPVTAVRVASGPFPFPVTTYEENGWLRVTPSMSEGGTEQMNTPSKSTRYNFSNPTRGGQGIVAADRLVIVKDPTNPAVIRWTSNQQGSYLDFTAARGGGFKTLTSGNLFIPACVKLWQNPQSTDTLTILCRGVDGYNTGYYMAPAQIASQSEATNIMGFEETTATPGTTSPYACEVFNNALYHPLDDQLMKSTATNYNINHKSQTDMIENMWKSLTRKEWMVSSVHDNRIYYIVNNPDGEPLQNGCNGNEIWVFDGGASSDKGGGSWSRWLIQAHSLRKVEQGGVIRMSVIRPSGIYYFDELYGLDDFVDVDQSIQTRAIPWHLETNTQGANRAHDAWAHLQQVNIVVGNFTGTMCYGVRGWNVHGKPVDICKMVSDNNPPDDLMFDLESYMLIRQDMKEWFFYARSVDDEETGVTHPSFGEINLVQYRYSPVSVNVGYEYGSIETFEYGRAEMLGMNNLPDPLTTDGIPRPYVDTRRP